MQLRDNMTILFQGDSITDAWRTLILPDGFRPFPLGTGYAYMVAARLMERFPDRKLNIVNRGVGGFRVRDLQRQWKADCLDLKPDLVSILVGINDTWRAFDSNDPSPIEAFRDGYRSLLQQVKDVCDPVIVIGEPFLLPHPEDRKLWRVDLDPRIQVVRELAQEFGAILVPYDRIFAEATRRAPAAYWAEDGVHPTPAAYSLMADSWLRCVLGDDASV